MLAANFWLIAGSGAVALALVGLNHTDSTCTRRAERSGPVPGRPGFVDKAYNKTQIETKVTSAEIT